VIVVKVERSKDEKFRQCAKFVASKGSKSLGPDFKIMSNNQGFKIYSGNDNEFEGGTSVELTIKKTINLNENNEEEFYRKLSFFFENCNKIMEKFTDGD